ncbi:MAG: hypothetical protein FJ338_05030, partial [Sphingomonadales bacterium]|nr:hypothetical protein [Sphingomonadales bacterium]
MYLTLRVNRYASLVSMGLLLFGPGVFAESRPWIARSYQLTMTLDTLGLVPRHSANYGPEVLPWRGKVLMLMEAGGSAQERLVMDLEGAWTVESVRWEGRELPFRYQSGRIECRLKGVKTGGLQAVEVHYSGHLVPALKPPWQDGVVV